MKLLGTILTIILSIFISACSTKLVSKKIKPDDLKTPTSIASYYLQRQDFGVRITRELVSCKKHEMGFGKVKLLSDIIPNLHADPEYRFSIPYDTLSNGTKTSNFEIEFTPDRTIKTINAKIEDKTAESISSAASIVGSVVIGVASDGVLKLSKEEDESEVKESDICTTEAINYLSDIETSKISIEALNNKAKELFDKLEVAQLVLAHKNSNASTIRKDIDKFKREQQEIVQKLKIAKAKIIDAQDFLTDTTYYYFKPEFLPAENSENTKESKFKVREIYLLSQETKKKWFKPKVINLNDTDPTNSNLNRFNVLDKTTAAHIALVLQAPAFKTDSNELPQPVEGVMTFQEDNVVDGLYFREPIEGDILICSKPCDANWSSILAAKDRARRAKETTASNAEPNQSESAKILAINDASSKMDYKGRFVIPQAGAIMKLSLKNDTFEENSVALAFSQDGRISKFSYSENASLTAALAAASGTIKTGTEVVKTQKSADLEKMKFENAELEAEKINLELKKQLKSLKAEWGD